MSNSNNPSPQSYEAPVRPFIHLSHLILNIWNSSDTFSMVRWRRFQGNVGAVVKSATTTTKPKAKTKSAPVRDSWDDDDDDNGGLGPEDGEFEGEEEDYFGYAPLQCIFRRPANLNYCVTCHLRVGYNEL